MGDWRPARGPEERLDRAIRSMVPGSLQGRVAQASPVLKRNRQRYPMDPDDVTELLAGTVQFLQDSYDVASPTALKFILSATPIEHSEHVYWNGVYQPGSEWTRAGQVITLLDPDAAIRAGDRITVEYAYYDEALIPHDGTAHTFGVSGAGQIYANGGGDTPFTVTFLVKVLTSPTTTKYLSSSDSGSGANSKWFCALSNTGAVEFRLKNGDMSLTTASGGNILDGRAHHVACVFDKTAKTGTLYIDGLQVASATQAGAINMATNSNWNIGSGYLVNSPAHAVLDEAAYFTKVLTPEEILAQYMAWGEGTYSQVVKDQGPFGYYRMDETTGGTAINEVGANATYYSGVASDTPALQKGQ